MGDHRSPQETTGELNIQRGAKFYGKLAARGKAMHMQRHEKYYLRTHTHTHTQPFGLWSGTTRVGTRYQKKHSPTHTHPDHRASFIVFLHLQRSMA